MKPYQKLLLCLFTFIFLVTRLPRLSNDEINPDAVNWHYRTQQFVVGLKQFEFEKTYQHYHPGVTLMWITGIPIEIFKQVTNIQTYDQYNFEAFHFVAKFSLVIVQFALTLLAIFLLNKFTGFNAALGIATLLTFEPFFVGNSRLYHMDILLTLFVFLSLVAGHISAKSQKINYILLTGFLSSLAFLTKSVGITVIAYIAFTYIKEKVSLKKTAVLLGTFALTTFLTFPALWVGPVHYFLEIFNEAERVGIRNGHDQIIFGQFKEAAGVSFYPLVLALKVSPVILLGLACYLLLFTNSHALTKLKDTLKLPFANSFGFYGGIYYLLYFLLMLYPSKKIDRYILVMFPMLAYFAYYGFVGLQNNLKQKHLQLTYKAFIAVLITLFWVLPFVNLFPFYFTYTNPLFGNALAANNIIGQKPFGIGIFDLKQHILNNYGNYPRLGFIDTKPMKSIYPNSKVFDIRVNGANDYDLLVLAINESAPEDVLKSSTKFEKSSTIYINGLPYWNIYVKRP